MTGTARPASRPWARRPRPARSSSSGFSKTYSMTGWRLGTLVAPPAIAKAVAELQSQMASNATTFAPVRRAGGAARKGEDEGLPRGDAGGLRPAAPAPAPGPLRDPGRLLPARRGRLLPFPQHFGLRPELAGFCETGFSNARRWPSSPGPPSAPRATCA